MLREKPYLENNLLSQLDFAMFFWCAVVLYSRTMQVKQEKIWSENIKIWKGKSFSYKVQLHCRTADPFVRKTVVCEQFPLEKKNHIGIPS